MSSKVSLLLVVASVLLLGVGCTYASNPITPSNDSSSIVGEYQFIGNDGTTEFGQVITTEQGMILVPDEQRTSCSSNFVFDVQLMYWGERGEYYGIPYYYRGDYVGCEVQLTYKLSIPLNNWLLHTQVSTWGVDESGETIYGSDASSLVFFQPREEKTVEMGYHLPRYFLDYCFSTVIQLDLTIIGGRFKIKIGGDKKEAHCW